SLQPRSSMPHPWIERAPASGRRGQQGGPGREPLAPLPRRPAPHRCEERMSLRRAPGHNSYLPCQPRYLEHCGACRERTRRRKTPALGRWDGSGSPSRCLSNVVGNAILTQSLSIIRGRNVQANGMRATLRTLKSATEMATKKPAKGKSESKGSGKNGAK